MLELVLEPFALGDVAVAPRPSDRGPVHALRLRVALDDAPVSELERVETMGLGLPIELPDLAQERLRVP